MKNQKTSVFTWEGINAQGEKQKGELELINLASARMHLKSEHITILKIKKKNTILFFSWKNKITPRHITIFTKELSMLLSANITLMTSLEILENNTKNLALKKMMHTIRQSLASGKSLSQALENFPAYFKKTFIGLVKAGENSGSLPNMLYRITVHHEKSEQLTRTIKKALFYPIMILMVSLIVTIAMLAFIVPQFSSLFHSVGAELPLLTLLVLKISESILHYGPFIFASILLISVFIYFHAKKSPKLQAFLDLSLLKIPLLGRILNLSILARSFSTLSILLRAGIPMLHAIHLTQNISNNIYYQTAFSDIAQKISSGYSMHHSIFETKKFPNNVTQMIMIGETSGTLDDMLENLGNNFQSQADDIAHNLSILLEPAIMIFLSAIVGTIIIAMYLPIFKLGTVI